MHMLWLVLIEKACEVLQVPEEVYEIVAAVAVGRRGGAEQLSEKLA